MGALTILMMLKLKGKEIGDYDKDCKCHRDFKNSTVSRLVISIFGESEGEPHIPEILADWTREDYLKAIKIADKIKEMLLDVNMDMIQWPEDFMCGNGKTFLDSLRASTNASRYDEETANAVANSDIKINPETRIFKHMDELRAIIHEEEIELSSENIGVIELGKQTYIEQQDIKAKQEELARRNALMQEKPDTLEIWN